MLTNRVRNRQPRSRHHRSEQDRGGLDSRPDHILFADKKNDFTMSEARIFNPKKIGAENRLKLVSEIEECAILDPLGQSRRLRELAIRSEEAETDDVVQALRLSVASSVLADLAEQGWRTHVDDGNIWLTPPSKNPLPGETVEKVKARIRKGLMIASDRQLATKATRDFVRSMERDRVWNGEVVSIKSLIDDGFALAERLSGLDRLEEVKQAEELSRIVRPVVQLCESDAVCEFTGIKLLDVWRYFRHTWALEYNSVPGRTMRFLIRNRARKNWPIVGIAMLASPAANYYVRDHWIGWRVDDVAERIVAGEWKANRVAQRLIEAIRESIGAIRSDDLVQDGELERPTEVTLFKLQQTAHRAEQERRGDLVSRGGGERDRDKVVDIRDLKKDGVPEAAWAQLSETSLYRKKRAEQLHALLRCLRYFHEADFDTAPGAAICEALVTRPGREAIGVALNEIRKKQLATDVADLSVCGAIPPYNHLLGGKLVALLMASKEVRDMYRNRYQHQTSEIASQMAGKPVVRPIDLKVITTTSLYGISSAQYNRLHLRKGIVPSLARSVRWEELKKTKGMTVTHLSKLTVSYMQRLGEAVYGRRRINSVFGEGSSPRTRQVREGLNLIGISDDSVLAQGLSRRVYACETYPSAKSDLHCFGAKTRYTSSQSVSAITQAWIVRWLKRRCTREDVLEALSECRPEMIPDSLHRRAARSDNENPREPTLPQRDTKADSLAN